jgi:hypothetical protein
MSNSATCVPSRSASSMTAVDAPDTRLSQCEHAHRTITRQAHEYPARTYLQGMGSWLPPLRTVENRDTFDQGNDSNQSHRTIQAGFEEQLNNIVCPTPTSQGLTPMERFEAEGVSEQPFSSARVNPNHNKDAGGKAGGKSR